MTNQQNELINIIRESKSPTDALAIAVEIITTYLQQHESSQAPLPEHLREHD